MTIIAQVWSQEPAGWEGTILQAGGTVMLVLVVGVRGTGTGTEEIEDLTRAMGLPESRNLFFTMEQLLFMI